MGVTQRKKQNVGVVYGGKHKMGGGEITRKRLKGETTKGDHWKLIEARRDAMYNALNFDAREMVDYAGDNDFEMEDGFDEGMSILPPPGDEAMTFSHAGGEYQEQVVLHSLLSKKTRQDDRDRADRVERQVKAWELQLPVLVKAYLAFQAHGPIQLNETTWSLQIPYDPHCANQLRTAYNAYLAIIREVKNLSDAALQRTSDVSFHTITCPPCTYELLNETKLSPRMLLAMDGNSSLKLVDPTHKSGNPRLDTRQLYDHRWVDAEEVDVMKDEVINAQKACYLLILCCYNWILIVTQKFKAQSKAAPSTCSGPSEPNGDADVPWLNINEVEDLAACVDTCVDRWKVAAPV
ncbi:hypothetical protein PQX77_002855 [Marasmius sp. AFHP31]|nr:hypothetical protein PQX77_002855 [Marasmius sp. AFHP31]